MFNYLLKLDSGEITKLPTKASVAKTVFKIIIRTNNCTEFRMINILSRALSQTIVQKHYQNRAEYIEAVCNFIDENLHTKEDTYIYDRLLELIEKSEQLAGFALDQSKDFYDGEQQSLVLIISELDRINTNINSILKVKNEKREMVRHRS